jgi:hypothetical protein
VTFDFPKKKNAADLARPSSNCGYVSCGAVSHFGSI